MQDGCAVVVVSVAGIVAGVVVGSAIHVCEPHEPQTDDAALDGRVCDLQLDPVIVSSIVVGSVVTNAVSGAQGPRDRTDGHGESAQGEFKRYPHVDVDARHGDGSAGECDLCKRIQEIMCMIIRELAKLGLELELTYLHRAYADAVGI